MVTEMVPAGFTPSLAAKVTVNWPVTVGVPETRPVEVLSVNPAGSAPDAIDQV